MFDFSCPDKGKRSFSIPVFSRQQAGYLLLHMRHMYPLALMRRT